MIVKLTTRERDTVVAALRRWLGYPAAREADSIATNGGKHKPLDNSEIERLCKRITKIESKRDAASLPRQLGSSFVLMQANACDVCATNQFDSVSRREPP